MKFRILLSFLLLFSINIIGQNNIVRQKCATCGKAKSQCPYKGNHHKPEKKCSTCGKVVSKCQYKGKHPAPKKCATCGMEISKCQYKGKHPVTKKCATCGKEVSKCQYKGNHPTNFDVTFSCNVPTANIIIDGTEHGTVSEVKRIQMGDHTVKVTAKGYKTYKGNITVNEHNTSFNIVLNRQPAPKPPTGSITVTSIPEGATVYIDGKASGKTPYQINSVNVGQHQIYVSLYNYRDEYHSVDVLKDENHDLNFVLQPLKPEKNKEQYFRGNGFYVSPGLQVGSLSAIGVAIGGYISNFNVEGYYYFGLSESDEVYWSPQSNSGSSYSATYKPSCYGLKVGYGIPLASNIRLTPQLGLGAVSLSGKTDGNNKAFNGSATSLGIGCKAEYAFLPYMSVGIAPELDMAISKSDTYTKISDATSSVDGWASGFNCRIFLSLFF